MPIKINGSFIDAPSDPRVSLLDLLREHLQLSGTKKGCDQGACGACTVLVDGDRILSCLALAVQFEGRSVTTIEGLAPDGALHPLQQAFIDEQAAQCGYCTAGMIMRAQALLDRNPAPSNADIRAEMEPNLCRCGTHMRVIRAIRRVSVLLQHKSAANPQDVRR